MATFWACLSASPWSIPPGGDHPGRPAGGADFILSTRKEEGETGALFPYLDGMET